MIPLIPAVDSRIMMGLIGLFKPLYRGKFLLMVIENP